jgi:hypothetical protein
MRALLLCYSTGSCEPGSLALVRGGRTSFARSCGRATSRGLRAQNRCQHAAPLLVVLGAAAQAAAACARVHTCHAPARRGRSALDTPGALCRLG